MARSPDQVMALYLERAKAYAEVHAGMERVENIYRGRTKIDLPDLDSFSGVSAPNLLAQGIDQLASRVSSVQPEIIFTQEKPNRTSLRQASTASMVLTGWNQSDRMSLQMKLRARHLLGLGMSPVIVRWDEKMHRPVREVRDPLQTYPSADYLDGTTKPVDVVFAFRRTVGWLCEHGYDGQVASVTQSRTADLTPDTSMLCLEYVDCDGRMLVLTGWTRNQYGPSMLDNWGNGYQTPGTRNTALMQYAPLDNMMCASVPIRISMIGTSGQFDSMVGMFYLQARLMALDVAKAEKDVYPDTWLISRQGEIARVIDGPHDGRTGLINIATGGDIKEMVSQPGPMTAQTIDRLERNQRVTAGIPAEFGGESGTNIRTGRRGDAVLASVIDYPIAEAQEAFSYALVDEHKTMIALARQYDGNTLRHIYVGTGNSRKPINYVVNQVFAHDEHTVDYPVNGTDMNNLLIGNGQRVGLGYMSTLTAARLDPFIDDPEAEHDRIIYEGLERALVQGLEQGAATQQIPPLVLAKVMQLVSTDKLELAEALQQVTTDAAKTQAAQQAAGPGAGPPTADQQMAGPAQAALAGAVSGPNQNQQSLSDLFQKLKRPMVAGQPSPAAPMGLG